MVKHPLRTHPLFCECDVCNVYWNWVDLLDTQVESLPIDKGFKSRLSYEDEKELDQFYEL